MSKRRKRLHMFSPVFLIGGSLKEFAMPLLAGLFFGRQNGSWEIGAAMIVLIVFAWSLLRAWCFHYEMGESALLVREGILNRKQMHIPFARIQGISQRRHLLHRMLGVTEVHLESPSGGKPEAILKVLSLSAAAELEDLLRDTGCGALVTATAPSGPAVAPMLHALPSTEILRLGLISNRGTIALFIAAGFVMQNQPMRANLGQLMLAPMRWLGSMLQTQVASGHTGLLAFGAAVGLLVAFILLRLLSVVLALLHYYGFTLTQEGERLQMQRGLFTLVRAGARLQRLQRWELEETWLHRRFQRCRLAVQVAGSTHEHDQGTSPGAGFTELAPIATPAQAHAMLRFCLPELDWEKLQWQRLHPATIKRRLIGQARLVLPAVLVLAWGNSNSSLSLPWGDFAALVVVVFVVMLWHANAWARFSAIAEVGDVLLFRSGVLTKRWVVVATSRLQNLRLYCSPLDRRLGIVHLQADARGAKQHRRALNIPCMDRNLAEAMREKLWRRIVVDSRSPSLK